MEKIGFYFDLIIRDGGFLLFLAILLGALVITWMIWHKVKMRKARSEYLDVKQFEN
jgi:hypothetical protein